MYIYIYIYMYIYMYTEGQDASEHVCCRCTLSCIGARRAALTHFCPFLLSQRVARRWTITVVMINIDNDTNNNDNNNNDNDSNTSISNDSCARRLKNGHR